MSVEETANLSGQSVWGAHRVQEHTQAHPLRKSAPKQQLEGHQFCLQEVGEVTESGVRAEQVALFPLWPLSHIQHLNTAKRVAPPWQINT